MCADEAHKVAVFDLEAILKGGEDGTDGSAEGIASDRGGGNGADRISALYEFKFQEQCVALAFSLDSRRLAMSDSKGRITIVNVTAVAIRTLPWR